MASLEGRLPRSASAESPLHAFSLTDSRVNTRPRRPTGGAGWRRAFGELWSQVATADLVGHRADPRCVAIDAKQHFVVVERDLLASWNRSEASDGAVLRSAVVTLECSARIWQAFGPAAGQRHLHLLRRLEETLARTERQVRAAERPLLVNRPSVSLAARGARVAIDDLLGATVDRAEALAALEDAAVELAALAVRVAVNLNGVGGARRGYTQQPPTLRRGLESLAAEVEAVARGHGSQRANNAEEEHLGVLLRTTLSVAFPADAIALAGVSGGDPCLRADALRSLRACWLELAGGLWAVVQGLDDLLAIGTFGDQERLGCAVSSRAGIALMAGGLCRRPSDFDHVYAWESHGEALCALVSDVCRALQTCEPDEVVRAQQLALRRLARALAAIWAVDEGIRSSVQASRPCR